MTSSSANESRNDVEHLQVLQGGGSCSSKDCRFRFIPTNENVKSLSTDRIDEMTMLSPVCVGCKGARRCRQHEQSEEMARQNQCCQ